MPYRFRAHIFWDSDPASMYHSPGHAQWAGQQVEQRLTMAFHLNEGARNEERSEFGSPDGFEWTCNVFVPDESKAILEDFFNHLLAESVRMTTKVIEGEGEVEYLQSYMDIHYCHNDVNQPCQAPYLTFETPLPDPPEPDNLCETSPAWTSQVWPANSYVKDDNKIWKAKAENTFTWIKPALTGDGAISWEFVKDCTVVEPPDEPGDPEPPANPCDSIALWDSTQDWNSYVTGELRKWEIGGVMKVFSCNSKQWAYIEPGQPYSGWKYEYDCPL